MTHSDGQEFDLSRFLIAQSNMYERAFEELSAGKKESHWMWFVFPQIFGLGKSDISRYFAIRSLGEAREYLAHPVLGSRLIESTKACMRHAARGAEELFGRPDCLKFCSSMTLFNLASQDSLLFLEVIDAFFDGVADQKTIKLAT
ncbi:MAG: DUF1810 domain-containing protein [Lysobacteraceae bacterium]